jgi:hypothetical protein
MIILPWILVPRLSVALQQQRCIIGTAFSRFLRNRALRLSSALKLTLRAMMLAPFSRSVAIVSVNP